MRPGCAGFKCAIAEQARDGLNGMTGTINVVQVRERTLAKARP
ncbi:hypothetical protein HMPREF0004_0790 [Achromobacter piechaudii ATCC 43553]|uniref:Uncharacterized protein n=1 Tax=Achromobacter piechaudii ATCC 43553 TaxID=742159 RepID=D4X5P3_9BURK|nr:hypothetical protein HMPREF0004_0790 [Achromobacter piechaudii ATCC 43553]